MRLFHKHDDDLEFGARCFFLLILLLICIGYASDKHQETMKCQNSPANQSLPHEATSSPV